MIRSSWLYFKQRIQARLLRPFLWVELILRWLVYLVSTAVSFATLILLLAAFWLLASEPGGSWLLRQVPGVQLEGFSGQLLNRWEVDRLSWQQEGLALDLTQLHFDWQPGCLLRWRLCLQKITVADAALKTSNSKDTEQQEPFRLEDFRMPQIQLPAISLPIAITLEQLRLGRFSVNQKTQLAEVQLTQVSWQKTRLQWQNLQLTSPVIPLDTGTLAQAQGQLDLQGDWPLHLQLQAQIKGQSLEAEIGGNLQQEVQLQRLATEDQRLRLTGKATLFNPTLPASLQLEVSRFQAAELAQLAGQVLPEPLAKADNQLRLESLQLQLAGNLEEGWQLHSQSRMQLAQQSWRSELKAKANWQGIELQKLFLGQTSKSGEPGQSSQDSRKPRLLASGQLDFESLQAQLNLDWQSLLGPDFPWPLFFDKQFLEQNPAWPPLQNERFQLQLSFDHQRQLHLGAALEGQLQWQAHQAQWQSHLAGHLDLADLPQTKPQASARQQLLAWAERLTLGIETRLEGELQAAETPFAASAALDFLWQGASQGYWLDLAHFTLKGPDKEHLEASLGLNSELWQLSFSSQLMELQQLVGSWVPQLTGDFMLSGQADLLPLLDLSSETLLVNEWQEQLLAADYRLRASTQSLGWQELTLEETALAAEYSGRAAASLGEQAISLHLISDHLKQDKDTLVRDLGVTIQGKLSEHRIQLQASHQKQPLSLTLQGGWQAVANGSSLVYQWPAWDLQNLAYLLPEGLRWQSQLAGKLVVNWLKSGLFAEAELVSNAGTFGIYQRDTEADETEEAQRWVNLDYQQLSLALELTPETIQSHLRLKGERLGLTEVQLDLALAADAATGQRALTGHYQLQETDLQLVQSLLNLDHLSGQLQGEGDLRGHLQAPEVWGELRILQLAAHDARWPLGFERLDASLALQGQQVQLNGDFQTLAQGQGQIGGEFFWQEELSGELRLKGQAIAARIEPWGSLQLDPDLRLGLQGKQVSLGGRLAVPRGTIEIQQLPPQAVGISSDVRVKNQPEPEPGPLAGFNLDLEVVLGRDRVHLKAFGLESDLRGRLRIGQEMATYGELRLIDGIYQSFGQDLRLRRAQLIFNGPIALPFLDIEAVRETESVVAGLRVTGRADQAETEIFSEPPMSNEQALSWLLTGAPLEAESDPNMLALSMGLASVSDYTQAAGDLIGIRELELTTEGSGEEASLVAAGHINDRLSVRYGIGLYEDISRVAVRYELTRQLYIEAVTSLENSLDIFWEVDY